MGNKKDTINRYVLGSRPRFKLTPIDQDGVFFVPNEARLSFKEPTGTITTFSGGDMTVVPSGYLYVLYKPLTKGYYEYEGWVKDSGGLEDAATKGFEVYDNVYLD